ncbi:hypothetical protein Thal_0496 [Thermocrinis albus DSM 14484]|uniref:Uncharacterized protein n=1 Tax=Thermocrinis albus (strain DSM 14484 / JCM 11386 / HI 11/12) TaxID=638303 RepID=D3SPP3_THEAH|nr:hypothetical protein [Thermocrinis albus]ADC89130.1 hypothetical protein Thal_0496 [Thermocrinis albus DSM 14484]
MRVRFRIALYRDGVRLTKEQLKDRKDPLGIGMRYVTEFKYLEATKWLMVAKDSYEKYLLLGLINFALAQDWLGREFLENASLYEPAENVQFFVEVPEKGLRAEIKGLRDVLNLQRLSA